MVKGGLAQGVLSGGLSSGLRETWVEGVMDWHKPKRKNKNKVKLKRLDLNQNANGLKG